MQLFSPFLGCRASQREIYVCDLFLSNRKSIQSSSIRTNFSDLIIVLLSIQRSSDSEISRTNRFFDTFSLLKF